MAILAFNFSLKMNFWKRTIINLERLKISIFRSSVSDGAYFIFLIWIFNDQFCFQTIPYNYYHSKGISFIIVSPKKLSILVALPVPFKQTNILFTFSCNNCTQLVKFSIFVFFHTMRFSYMIH